MRASAWWVTESRDARVILDLLTPPGCGFQIDAAFPGCVLRTTRGYRLPSLRDEDPGMLRRPEATEGGAGLSWPREKHPNGDGDVAAPFW